MTARRIGLISDTHGLLRPEALAFLAGCAHIIHAGDIGTAEILDQLARIAPTSAVRGNNDKGTWADAVRETERVQFGNVTLYVVHDIAQLAIDPKTARIDAVVCGHSHRPQILRKDGVLYVNPGSAGRRRFKLPVSIGELLIDGTTIAPGLARLVESPGNHAQAFVRDA